jgi:uncharacterized HhH-GPD family protein
MSAPVDQLPYTGNPDSDRLLAQNPLALLIGFALDQQVTLQKAFSGPADLRGRLGHLDAARIAIMDPDELAEVFRRPPALHRFPGSMAGKVQALCSTIATTYDNDAGRIWRDAASGAEIRRRLLDLPGFGDMKVATLLAVLSKQLGVNPPGMAEVLPARQTLGDARSAADVAAYQAAKRAYKAELRAQGKAR